MTNLTELKNAIVAWRKAEKELAQSMLASALQGDPRKLRDKHSDALTELRRIVDSEPWADIEKGL